ncbi:MAG TPA: hypothetical protein VNO35_00440 [Steroidobacteraceae bacterium]|nr:hypothetical protein [Steroidobacteraceae bacterium]
MKSLDSELGRQPAMLQRVQRLNTSGARSVEAFVDAGTQYLAVANSLTADVRFGADSHICRIAVP